LATNYFLTPDDLERDALESMICCGLGGRRKSLGETQRVLSLKKNPSRTRLLRCGYAMTIFVFDLNQIPDRCAQTIIGADPIVSPSYKVLS
jgi:hypothetical protein